MANTIIVEDSRQQPGKHENIREYCEENGIRIIRSKLLCGDYSLPTNQSVCIDTKQGLGEVYNNLVQDHDRFARECDLAYELGIHLVILVEEPDIDSLDDVHNWVNPRVERYMMIQKGHSMGRYTGTSLPPKKPIESDRFEKMMRTFADHHHGEWRFCDKSMTGAVLMEILCG